MGRLGGLLGPFGGFLGRLGGLLGRLGGLLDRLGGVLGGLTGCLAGCPELHLGMLLTSFCVGGGAAEVPGAPGGRGGTRSTILRVSSGGP